MLPVQLRHLLPEWQEILGVPPPAPSRPDEGALVDPPSIPPGEPGHLKVLPLARDLAGGGGKHLPGWWPMALQDEVQRRRLQGLPPRAQPGRQEDLAAPRPPAAVHELRFA